MSTSAKKYSKRMSRPRVTVGAVPGQLVEHAGSRKGKIRLIRYDGENHFDEVIESVSDLSAYAKKKPRPSSSNGGRETPARDSDVASREVLWINIDGVGDIPMLEEISRKFGIHPLAMEDVINVHQHAKLEVYGEMLFFVVRMPTGTNGFQTEQVSIFLTDNAVITIQERPGDCLDPVRHRIVNSLGRIRRRRADYLAYAIIDAIVDGYFPLLQKYAEKLDEVGDMIDAGGNRKLPLHLHDIRGDLLLIRKVINQHRIALNEVTRSESELISSDTALYFRDCQDHIQQLMEAADTDRETCGELRELYFAMLGEKNNDVMKVLTIIATIFIPMSFVAGIYGMNFDNEASMLNMPELHWAFGYPFALSLMGIMAGGLLVFLYRKGWLS